MAALTDTTIASTYKQLLKLTSEGVSADASAKYVEDGLGTDTALSLSTTRVGIGTASPDHELHVEGENPRIQIESTSAGLDNTGLIFAHGGTAKYELWHDEDAGAFNFDQSVQTDGWGFNFRTYPSGGSDNTTAMTILGNGKVGIGGSDKLVAPHHPVTIRYNDAGETTCGLFISNDTTTDDTTYTSIKFGSHDVTSPYSKQGIGILREATASDGSYGVGDMHFMLDANADAAEGTFANDTKVTFTHDGKVGIGLKTPGGKLHIQSASKISNAVDSAGDELILENSADTGMTIIGNNDAACTIYFGDQDDANNGYIQYNNSGPKLEFGVNGNTNVAHFDSSGNIQVTGTTFNSTGNNYIFNSEYAMYFNVDSPGGTAERYIFGSGRTGTSGGSEWVTFKQGYAVFDYGGTDMAISTNTDCMQFLADTNNNGGTVNPFEWWHDHATINSGTRIMYLDTGGDLTITGNITEGSDERLKTDITDIGSCLDKINSLKPITYKWKEDTPTYQNGKDAVQIGFTAQDVEKYFPEVVKDDNDTSYKSLSYARLVTPLIKAVQELSAELEELKTELQDTKDYVDHKQDYNSMAGRINSCEARIGNLEKK